jgi:hypothetical protein
LVAKKQLVVRILSTLAEIIAKSDIKAAGSLFSYADNHGRLDTEQEDDDDDEDYAADFQKMAQSCLDVMAISIQSKYFVEPALNLCAQVA